jgi:hypothetical protein
MSKNTWVDKGEKEKTDEENTDCVVDNFFENRKNFFELNFAHGIRLKSTAHLIKKKQKINLSAQ